jgi:hypothetical protein
VTRALALSLALTSSAALADEPRGFAELRLSWFPGAAGDKVQVVERVRPTFQLSIAERVKLVGTIEAGLAEGRDTATVLAETLQKSALGPLLTAAQCAPTPYTNGFLHLNGAKDYLDVDRLYLDVYLTHLDVRIGRQAINWGSARFFNPTDPFPQVLLTEPWRPRRGINAVRVNVPVTSSADLTAVAAANDTFTAVRASARARVNWKGTDFAVVGAYRGDANNGLVGLDARGTLGVGYWLEAALSLSAKPHEEFSVGLDYSFKVLEQLSVFAQYYRNGAGALSPDHYTSATSRLATASPIVCPPGGPFTSTLATADPFAPFTVARDYLLVGASLGITPDLMVSATALQNLDDGTALLLPSVTYAVLDWLDVSASASIPTIVWGSGGEFKPRPQDLRLSVETPSGTLSANLSGLVPAATLTLWTRASF